MREAALQEALGDGVVRCNLCAFRCEVKPGRPGLCHVRVNEGGKLYTLVYGLAAAAHRDPIEKKPFFHFLPGAGSFSLATVGCNFRCRHCQNWDLSQRPLREKDVSGRPMTPEEFVELAVLAGAETVAYTYTEPTIFMEYALDACRIARARGLRNLFVSNGYQTPEAIALCAPWLDGINIDLKGFTDRFYTKVCGGARLQPVLDAIRAFKARGVWTEVTTLVIPGRNDDPEEFEAIAAFLRSVDPEMPWHVTAFHPDYRMADVPPTPPETLRRAREIGLAAGLKHVYIGNVPGERGEDTFCPDCGAAVIERRGFRPLAVRLRGGACPRCGRRIAGVWREGAREEAVRCRTPLH